MYGDNYARGLFLKVSICSAGRHDTVELSVGPWYCAILFVSWQNRDSYSSQGVVFHHSRHNKYAYGASS